jgi:opacity protein-like surface antigen
VESGTDLGSATLDDTWTLGGGIGYYFTPSIRGDITYDHRFEADASGSVPAGPALDGGRTFGIESDVVLFNLYYDFNRSGRFSPYLGAGVGFTFNSTTNGATSACVACTGTIDEGEDTDFAAALMAGFTTRLSGGPSVIGGSSKDGPVAISGGRSLYLDAGYRFLYLGDVTTGQIVNTIPVNEAVKAENITAHEFRVGLRYDFR